MNTLDYIEFSNEFVQIKFTEVDGWSCNGIPANLIMTDNYVTFVPKGDKN